MDSKKNVRTALGALPDAANARVGQSPAAKPSAAAGQENAPLVGPSFKKPGSMKRKSIDEDSRSMSPDPSDVVTMKMDEDCDQVRRKINRLLDSGEITKTAFAKEIGVGVKSVTGFLAQHGHLKGSGCAAYVAAWKYFKIREIAGVKLPTNKKQKTTGSVAGEGSSSSAAGKTAKGPLDLSDIELDGEEYDDVPVFDTCDEIRRKINAHFKKSGTSQAQFCRDVHAQLYGPDRPAKPFTSAQLAKFRSSKGPINGAKLPLFYACYVFFEKMRIKEGKPKTKLRLEMEELWEPLGLPRDRDSRDSFICFAGTHPYVDKYGNISVF
ncbi:uncharacterized protein B0H64DRAFT_22491 [Chaetomium fimeti]|uniref:DUF7726 domain-containing protein n=1 Tax=Chaetomium fimeti TaxID=1854472 RepID=A0AAE0LXX4_9PEZI|nr:hypothetical protein B0H64DRAFT_22491 [Chaetomium fimeti]